ncbi:MULTISPECIES: 4-hydroxy-tetrahydrodipicolinate reductase [unclassified Gemella]|uniref:4-hydroxy-tetrahydrodipicolinate reductase n=1 Tax=unclassified Gemella TaxID=2624949 RepID=UPI001C051D1A|nr:MULTISPECIES: 4-hydroxy-tetrahydrodipicolinate reductase [unclassified Gemella]MBU0278063.1 4-hydroxy-tetrahydrodipicolinate reductase [Gemella sp. zg-1178]QWQ38409.1 4-hydroxy-tetrahydrodipicolinate reductase [Gemella sp. zg-570]
MKIIISGYSGTMGKVLVDFIKECEDDIEIVAGVSKNKTNTENFSEYESFDDIKEKADVIIDFSHHSLTKNLVTYAAKSKTNVVIATTGHDEEELFLINKLSQDVALVYSGNYSLGVNVVLELVNQASKMLYGYDIEVIEKHHNKKVDAPSGTAKMIVDSINNVSSFSRVYGREGESKRKEKEIGIHAVRGGTIVGEHEIIFAGEDEIIEIKHTALSKKMFAKGSIKAAFWLKNKKTGIYSMKDVLNLK